MNRLRIVFAVLALAALATTSAQADDSCEYPRVLIVLDHSDSMSRTIEGGEDSLWTVTVEAIRQLVTTYEDSIAFGLVIFPDPVANGCAPGTVMLDPAPEMGEEIIAILENDVPIPDRSLEAYTPIKQTFDALTADATLWDSSTRNYVLFMTDGEQYCDCPDGEDQGPCTADSSRPAQLLAMGIPSFIVGLSSQTNSCLMARMAITGGTAREGCPYTDTSFPCDPWFGTIERADEKVCYYQADAAGEMTTAFDNIARQVTDEQCDLLDNDCDGLTDEDLVETCETPCGAGERSCIDGTWDDCEPLQVPDESCNNADDDCDGETDEDLTRPCYTDCGDGLETCMSGAWVNCDAQQPIDEQCGNALDDDCDGDTDEGCECTPQDVQTCGQSDEGKCHLGTQTCGADGTWGPCDGNVDPVDELCNGADDDCDGFIDEELEQTCETACGAGTEHCEAGSWIDCTAPAPAEELCDGIDDDCDGDTDEDIADQPCTSACGEGTESCTNGDWTPCTAPAPNDEVCNGLDDDCDDEIDEEAPCPEGQSCQAGVCTPTDGNTGLPIDSSQGSADSCQAGGHGAPMALFLLLGLVAVLVSRRRFTA